AAPDGSRRTLAFLILTVCSDVGGYLVGSLLGRHHMAAVISPNKTWEGLGGSVLACVVAGVILFPVLLHGPAWQGGLVGLGSVTAAILGDLSESMIKRDLQIKDMGTVLPGHGGVLDRIDAMLISAPVVWLLLVIFLHCRFAPRLPGTLRATLTAASGESGAAETCSDGRSAWFSSFTSSLDWSS